MRPLLAIGRMLFAHDGKQWQRSVAVHAVALSVVMFFSLWTPLIIANAVLPYSNARYNFIINGTVKPAELQRTEQELSATSVPFYLFVSLLTDKSQSKSFAVDASVYFLSQEDLKNIDITPIASHLMAHGKTLSSSSKDGIVISTALARDLKVDVGDEVYLQVSLDPDRMQHFVVSGILQTPIDQSPVAYAIYEPHEHLLPFVFNEYNGAFVAALDQAKAEQYFWHDAHFDEITTPDVINEYAHRRTVFEARHAQVDHALSSLAFLPKIAVATSVIGLALTFMLVWRASTQDLECYRHEIQTCRYLGCSKSFVASLLAVRFFTVLIPSLCIAALVLNSAPARYFLGGIYVYPSIVFAFALGLLVIASLSFYLTIMLHLNKA